MFMYCLIMLFQGGVQKQSRARAKTPPSPKMGSRAPGTAGTAGLAPDSPSALLREEPPGAVARSDRISGSASPHVAIDGPPWGGPRWLARGAGHRLKNWSCRFFLNSVKSESNTSRRACPGLTKIDWPVLEKIASTFERAFSRVGALAPRVARSGAPAPGGGRLDT